MTAPHVPAAFINAIAEEGTKDEAVAYLQKQWNENCALRERLAAAEARNTAMRELLSLDERGIADRLETARKALKAAKPFVDTMKGWAAANSYEAARLVDEALHPPGEN